MIFLFNHGHKNFDFVFLFGKITLTEIETLADLANGLESRSRTVRVRSQMDQFTSCSSPVDANDNIDVDMYSRTLHSHTPSSGIIS